MRNPLATATLKNWQVPRTSVNPKYAKNHPVDALAQTLCDAGATMSAAYRQVAIDAYVANVNANNAAQEWRNRAIEAEEEIREGGRGIALRKGFER